MLRQQGTVTTDSNGNYSFENLAAGTYIVIPELGEKNFMPTFRQVVIIDDDVTDEDFEALVGTAPVVYGSISGVVQRENGSQIVGEALQLTGLPNNQGRLTISGAGGLFVFTDLPDGTFTVRPVSTQYVYDPASVVITISNASNHSQTFTAVSEILPPEPPEDEPYIISGRVIGTQVGGSVTGGFWTTDPGDCLVTLTWTGIQRVTLTDNAGNYQFAGLPNGSYNIAAIYKYGYAYSPLSQVVVVNNANAVAGNITLTITYLISGTIRYEDNSVVGVNWIVEFVGPRTGGVAIGTTPTTAVGLFTIAASPPGNYVLTPVRAGYRFEPPSRTITLGTAHSTLNDFTAIPL